MEVQIFGVKGDADTRKALRFFKERRIRTHFVDLKVRPASRGELRRFVERFGIEALINRDSRRFQALGLAAAHYSGDRWLEILCREPLLLTMPLVRSQHHLTAGWDEKRWREWVQR